MVPVVGRDVLWLGECVDDGEGGSWVGLFGGGPECVSGGDGEEDECYAGPVG